MRSKIFITVEDNILSGGFGSGVLEFFAGCPDIRPKQLQTLGFPDCFVEHGKRSQLMARYSLTAKGLAEAAQGFYEKMNDKNGD